MGKYAYVVAATVILVVLYLFAYRVRQADDAWNRQPPEAKAAAAQLETRLKNEIQAGDFIAAPDGSLWYVEEYAMGTESVRVSNCHRCSSGPFPIQVLARDRVRLVHRGEKEHGDLAAIFLK